MHFLSNMIFLMFFGAFIERLCGSLALLLIYLGSGFIGAGVFVLWSGVSTVPLVGASAAVSGIMAFLCVYLWQRPIKYIYWLFIPIRGYAGFVYLPAWVAFVAWAMTDLSGYLGETFVGGVAYTAHLGGDITGALAALAVLAYKKYFLKQTFKKNHRGFISGQVKV
ncbi:MAG: rhomboid family intramembrane serine protease [Bdellovibrionales bacterium]